MKKGQIVEGYIKKVEFPNRGILEIEDHKIVVKDTCAGQKVRVMIQKVRKQKNEARLIEILERSHVETQEPPCEHFGICGGCALQTLPYEEQTLRKASQVKELLDAMTENSYSFEGIKGSPKRWAYRNKMEFTFGDEYKDGPLSLGLHKKGSFYDIVTTDGCKIVEEDYNMILSTVLQHFAELHIPHYKKIQHTGILRHLLIRKAEKTQEILIALVTTSFDLSEQDEIKNPLLLKQMQSTEKQEEREEKIRALQKRLQIEALVQKILSLSLNGTVKGILHTINDSLADMVKSDKTILVYGQEYFYEELLGLTFKISPFSFFQTNSMGAERLYETVREFIGDTKDKLIYDLYSGTGTIAQILAPVARKVVGVEIVEEAVEAAKQNAIQNNLSNCEFIAGDVLKVLDQIKERPDLIVLDPPRDGCNPKALSKIIDYGVERMVYISCKPTSLARDLEMLQGRGYRLERVVCCDLFPWTVHVETVALLVQKA